MSKLTLETIVAVISKESGVEITEDECKDVAHLFSIDLDVLNNMQLVRTVVHIAVTKKFFKNMTKNAPGCFELDLTSIFKKSPGLKEKFQKEWGVSDAIDFLALYIAEIIAKEQGNDQIH